MSENVKMGLEIAGVVIIYVGVALVFGWGWGMIWRMMTKDMRRAEKEYNEIAGLLKEVDERLFPGKKINHKGTKTQR